MPSSGNNTRQALLNNLFGIEGQVAVVTGASSGIGRDIALNLGKLGARVIVAARKASAAESVAAEVVAQGGEAVALPLEVDKEDSVLALFAQVKARFGRVDILVNNAGIFPVTPLLDTTGEEWEAIHRTNARGTFLCLREAAKIMKEVGQGGRIINISSNASIRSSVTGRFAYNASKAAVNRLTQEAAQELAPLNILVNAVLPGPVATENLATLDEKVQEAVRRKIPMGRWGKPQEIAAAVIYFASRAGDCSVGQPLVVDGGALLG
jgi:NAD(P)-dependent dehydrogenase (short-subunit alcohol dehydrogenase family)